MVGELKLSKLMVTRGVSPTKNRAACASNMRAARDSDLVMVRETYDGLASSTNNRFPKQAGKPPANNEPNNLGTSDPSRNKSVMPKTMDYKIGWICALPFETAAAEVMLDEQHPELPYDPWISQHIHSGA